MDDGGAFGQRAQPANVEAEQALVSALMQNGPTALSRVDPGLAGHMFADAINGILFEKAKDIISRGATADPVTVHTAARQDPLYELGGGYDYVLRVYSAGIGLWSAGSTERWVEDIIRCWVDRRGLEIAHTMVTERDPAARSALLREQAALNASGADRPSFDITVAADLAGRPIPDRAWLVPGWLPLHQCTLFSGSGGVGKSQVGGIQLQASTAVGASWLGWAVERVRSLGIYCEDDESELHRRMASVAASMGADLSDFGDMAWRSAIVDAHEMVEEDGRGGVKVTPYYGQVVAAAKAFKAQLLILDSSANLFGGDEIKRRQVRAFLTTLNRLAIEIDGAVLLLSHPSAAGTAARTGNSGSTHWPNGVRSMLYMEQDPDPDADPDTRIITRVKSNYARKGDSFRVQWRDGVFHALDEPGSLDRTAMASKADRVFLALLQSTYTAGEWVSPRMQARNYAPTIFARHSGREGVGKPAFESALHRLQQRGAIVSERYGPPSKDGARLRPA
ncbi:RecA-family ATPase [Stella humosa]|uniref:RecA-family ATPase n=1 Tax=Stella humosa TaxID=94 RepID=A0A3N1M0V9_9PROT|nr:AAA family ATPase [Stella humosa]ROQ01144.1 RecA-family ATPase [Stella humosa]BBK31519.1 hypothetical protein STHU_21530 [Stella humosa]